MDGFKSYLKARDPSILAWNKPTINPSVVKKNLFTDSVLESEPSSSEAEHLMVYLRIKPTDDFNDLYEISENTLVCRVPPGSQVLRNVQANRKITKKFSFSKIYDTDVTQTEIFNSCIKKKVLEFINGSNPTIFTYGASGSGKTYTILGTADDPGIIPRALEYIFRTLPDIEDVPTIKPASSGEIVRLDTTARRNEVQQRNRILNETILDKSEHAETYKLMQERLSIEPTAILGNSGVSVGVWVSFTEIYNEYVYDLLVPEPTKGKLRPKLRLAQDSEGNTYVRDLKNISVSCGLEAYEVLQYGMQNLNYASTNLNSHSSRSHCIFTIKLVQWINETDVLISYFNFCDLAGSERAKSTKNVGKRLQESNNINTSLHVLGRCIESIRKNQKDNDSKIVPYRDSKLTRLFQRALSGRESLTMLVNINSSRAVFDESQHVLNFSALAQKIIMEKEVKPEKPNAKKRFSQYISGRSTALPSITETETEILRDQIEMLLLEIENMKQNWAEHETEIRRDIIEKYRIRIEELRNNWIKRSEDERKNLIETYESKIRSIQEYYNNRKIISGVIEIDDSSDENEPENVKPEEKEQSRNSVNSTTNEKDENLIHKSSEIDQKSSKRRRTCGNSTCNEKDPSEIDQKSSKRRRITVNSTTNEKYEDLIHKSLEIDQIKKKLQEKAEKYSNLETDLTQLQLEFSVQNTELKEVKNANKKLLEELATLRQKMAEKDGVILDAQVELEELEREKKESEQILENMYVKNADLHKTVSDLNNKVNVLTAKEAEQAEYVEELEEKLKMFE